MTLTAAALWLATDQVATTWVVQGTSMVPTLQPGDRVIIDRWTYRHRPPRSGEVVVVEAPGGQPWVKRVARVQENSGVLWLLGDNPASSLDSRRIGGVRGDAVAGRVRCRYWPIDRAGRVR
jgi:nickel-type superoxide dismutase maturation protease